MLKKILCTVGILLALLGGVSNINSQSAFASEFVLSYNIDEKTSYSAPDEYNVARVRMVKTNYVEEYWIQFYKDWFVVRDVYCQHIGHMEELFDELYARQAYAPNPRVTSVRNALLSKGLLKPLANKYYDTKVSKEQTAVQYVTQFINVSKQIGPSLLKRGPIECYKKITDMDNVTYYYVDVACHPSEGNGELAKFQVNQYGEIFYYVVSKSDYINVDYQFTIE